jgi:hypothetical protein
VTGLIIMWCMVVRVMRNVGHVVIKETFEVVEGTINELGLARISWGRWACQRR